MMNMRFLISVIGTLVAQLALAARYDVTSYGAKGDDKLDDFTPIEHALRDAGRESYSSGASNEVYFPAGTYYVSSTLHVYPNTTITCAPDVAIVSTMVVDGGVLHGEHFKADGTLCEGDESCKHGGYTQVHDIVISGGVWDRNSPSTNNTYVFNFRHGRNITLRDLVVRRASNHMVNLSGSSDLTVQNSTFKDAVAYKGDDATFWGDFKPGDPDRYKTIEAVHLDTIDSGAVGEPTAFPLDNTPCQSVTIQNCLFLNVFSGLGSHHEGMVHSKDITVKRCTFSELQSFSAYLFSADNVIMRDSVVKGGHGVLRANGATVRVNHVVAMDNTDNAIYLDSGTQATIENVCISNSAIDKASVRLCGGAEATVTACDFYHPGTMGFSQDEGSRLLAVSNTVIVPGKHAFYCVGGSFLSASDNTVSGPGECGFMIWESSSAELTSNQVVAARKFAFRASDKSSMTMQGNKAESSVSDGCYVDGAASLVAEGNKFTNCGGRAIRVWGESKTCVIRNNTIECTASEGVYIRDGITGQISGNVIRGAKGHGIRVENVANVTAEDNVVSSSGAVGIICKNAQNCVLWANTITGSSNQGIKLESAQNCSVLGNTVKDSLMDALLTVGTVGTNTSATVRGNKLVIATGAAEGYYDLRIGQLTANSVFTDNILGARGHKMKSGLEDVTYTAGTEGLSTATLVFDANGGTVSETSRAYAVGDCYGSFPTPVRVGYLFDGWFTSPNGGHCLSETEAVLAIASLKVYANWTDVSSVSYVVSFDAAGGAGATMSQCRFRRDCVYRLPKCTYVRPGCRFVGWVGSNGRRYDDEVLIFNAAQLKETLTLTARWEEVQ